MKPNRIRKPARLQIAAAILAYQQLSPSLGKRMLDEIDSALKRIEMYPEGHTEVLPRIRRAILKDFRYGIFYTVTEHSTLILAFLHQAEDPDKWPRA